MLVHLSKAGRRCISYRNLDRLEGWDAKNRMKFNKKCKVLHLAQNNQRAQYRLRSVGWGAALLKRTQRSWWNMSQVSTTTAMKANQIQDRSHRGITISGRGMIILLSPDCTWSTVSCSGPYSSNKTERVYRRAMKITKSLENLHGKNRLKE